MKILTRNFIRLMSVGAFDANDTVEPMSDYKWRRLVSVAHTYNVLDFIYNGIAGLKINADNTIPTDISIKALEEKPVKKQNSRADENKIDISTASGKVKAFSNFYLNRKYNKLIFNEIHSIDTSLDTLVFMKKLTDNISTLLETGISFKTLADLGHYLRQNGDKVDFVKTDNWIKSLKIQNVTELIGSCLTIIFHFESDELPFVKSSNPKYSAAISQELENMLDKPEKYIRHADNKPKKGINPISKPSARPLRYYSFQPLETSSRFMSNVLRSLSNIDE